MTLRSSGWGIRRRVPSFITVAGPALLNASAPRVNEGGAGTATERPVLLTHSGRGRTLGRPSAGEEENGGARSERAPTDRTETCRAD
jgi:hypothetical protein